MASIIECIPNFSEGKDQRIIQGLEEVVKQTRGVTLLDTHSDENHHRSVLSFFGHPEGVEEAAFRLAEQAVQTIDLRRHRGEHPRMGAMDVLPFVPLRHATMEECIALSRRVGERIWRELRLPVFLYEKSATAPHRENLADIRRGGFEQMPNKLLEDEWAPDYGTRQVHPSAGVVAVGARLPLIAFNVNLNTDDLEIAREIARCIRFSSGGYRYCKAIGIKLHDRGLAQVSMNLVNYEETPIYRVFESIRFEAKRYGVSIHSSELVGLAPAKALLDAAAYYLKLENHHCTEQVLEYRLLDAE